MKAYFKMLAVEILKLRRTLALGITVIAPLVVITLQVFIWLNNKAGYQVDVDLWLAFLNNVLSMWAIFMQSLLIALVAALIYQVDHSSQGWLRLYAMPIPRWTIPAAKITIVIALITAAMLVLVAGSLLGARIADALHPNITLPEEIPYGTIAVRAGKVLWAALVIVAIQNFVSFRWPSMTVPLGVGITGTFLALFASSWKFGSYYPWLMPILTLHAKETVVARIQWFSPLAALVLFALMLVYAARRQPGLYP